MKRNIQPGTVIAVKWIDSRPKAGWIKKGDDVPLGQIVSVGFLVATDRAKLTLSTSMQNDNAFSLDPLSIPWVAVKHIIELGGQRGIFKRVSGSGHSKSTRSSNRKQTKQARARRLRN